MKFIVSILLIALLSFATCLFFSWWTIAIVAFIVAAVIPQSPGRSFLTGFLALFLLWGILSFSMSSPNEHILADKVSMIIMKVDNPYLLVLVTALIGGVVAGFAAMAGSFLNKKNATA